MLKIVFDVDGVLIHGFHCDPKFTKRWDEHLETELEISPNVMTDRFFNTLFADVIIGKRDLKPALQEFLNDIDSTVTPDHLIDFWMKNDSNIDEELIDYIKRLKEKSIPLYVATNQEHVRANYLWNELDFKAYFSDIFYSAKIGCAKPDPLYFSHINNNIGKDNILFFDDREDNIEAARECGWNAVLYRDINDLSNHPIIKDYLS